MTTNQHNSFNISNLKKIIHNASIPISRQQCKKYKIIGERFLQTIIVGSTLFMHQSINIDASYLQECINRLKLELTKSLEINQYEKCLVVTGIIYHNKDFWKIERLQDEMQKFVKSTQFNKNSTTGMSKSNSHSKSSKVYQMEVKNINFISNQPNPEKRQIESDYSYFVQEISLNEEQGRSKKENPSFLKLLDQSSIYQPNYIEKPQQNFRMVSSLSSQSSQKKTSLPQRSSLLQKKVYQFLQNLIDYSAEMNHFIGFRPNRITLIKDVRKQKDDFYRHYSQLLIVPFARNEKPHQFLTSEKGKNKKQARDKSYFKLFRDIFVNLPEVFRDYKRYKFQKGIIDNDK